ncbi:MAG TPA: tRNA dihydrouridine synthase DusB [Bacillota bacterium]|nr:tRNA dihydrouridine synthase DusB [Bacillota bacterium]HPL54217.1 tRNA dihydrouridine synthase DusB [Bacillota bacterium]
MRIGNVNLSNNIFLAPMAGVTDMVFRILCKRQGCGLTYTEMVSAKGLHYKSDNTAVLLEIAEEERPAAVQIFGSEPDIVAEAARQAEAGGAAIIDINMGCPTPKIVKNGDGSALMKKPGMVREIIRSTVRAVKVPVTIKIRKGWDEESVNAAEIATIAALEGAAAVTVHGRTRDQYYSGNADWDIIKQVKKTVNIPVIGNGDIVEPEDVKKMIEKTGCDAVMIGRGAQGNPWIFRRSLEYIKTGRLLPMPDYEQRVRAIIMHLDMVSELKGEEIGVKEMRKHTAWYIKGMPGSAKVKAEIFRLTTCAQVKEILSEYMDYLKVRTI